MPDFVVEHSDSRSFAVTADNAEEACTMIAQSCCLLITDLTAQPKPHAEHEWGTPFFVVLIAGFALFGLALTAV